MKWFAPPTTSAYTQLYMYNNGALLRGFYMFIVYVKTRNALQSIDTLSSWIESHSLFHSTKYLVAGTTIVFTLLVDQIMFGVP